jgi:hypothetical protein
MGRQQAGGGRKRTRRFVPTVESLEDRCVPACNFIVRGGTLFVTAPTTPLPTNDRIVLSDNGGNGPNNVVGFCGAPFFPNVPINHVVVRTGPGNDTVTYNLTGDLTTARQVDVRLGRGNNVFSYVQRRNILGGGSLTVNARGGRGDDRLQATLIGSLAANAHLALNFDGGRGNNFLSVQSATSVNVAAGASLTENLVGNGASDHVFSTYTGLMNGTFSVNESLGRRSGSLSADVELAPGSQGKVGPSALLGGRGNDRLTFVVHNGPALANDLTLDGGPGFDTCFRTTNVASFNCESDTIVP